MCDPLTIAAIAATVAGAGLQQAGAKKSANAERTVFNAAGKIQDQHRKDADAVFNPLVDSQGATNQIDQINQNSQSLGDKLAASVTSPSAVSYLPGTEGASSIIKNVASTGANKTAAAGELAARLRGAVSAFGQTQVNNNREFNDAGEKIGQITNFGKGDAGLVPLQMAAAQGAGQGLADAGKFVSGIGQAAGMASTFGAGPSWGDVGSYFSGAPAAGAGFDTVGGMSTATDGLLSTAPTKALSFADMIRKYGAGAVPMITKGA